MPTANLFPPFFPFLQRWVVGIERSHSALPLFVSLVALLVVHLWPAAWTANEENYFQLAYHTFAPDKFSQFYAVFDASRARVVPLYLLGAAVQLFGYDGAHAISRILIAILYAAGLTYFLSALRLSVWDGLLIVVVFILANEGLIGAEWLFKGVEPKTMAYALLFFAFGLALRRRWTLAIVACATATYMHFLVGGFWTAIILAHQLWETKQRRQVIRSLAAYGILILPLAWLIARDQLVVATASANILAGQIYASRHPWHVAPFASRAEFLGWTPGIVAIFGLLLILGTVGVRHRYASRELEMVSRTALFGLVYLLLALGVAFVDRHTQLLGRFYLFRPSSLTLLFALTVIVALLSQRFADDGAQLKSLVIFAAVAWFWWATVTTQVYRAFAKPALPERAELLAAIASHTEPGDIILIEPAWDFQPDYLSLLRQIPRPTLVNEKFVPTNPADILRWQSYKAMRTELFENGCVTRLTVPVRWLVTLRLQSVARVASCGTPIWRTGNVALIRVIH